MDFLFSSVQLHYAINQREKLTDVKLSTLQKVAALTGLTVSELLSVEMTEEESGLVSGSV